MLNTIAASQTDQVLSKVSGGSTGMTGDRLDYVLVIPASTSPGAVTLKDGNGAAITLFAGGASSVATLHPFTVPVGEASKAGGWKLTTGANVSAIAFGNFT